MNSVTLLTARPGYHAPTALLVKVGMVETVKPAVLFLDNIVDRKMIAVILVGPDHWYSLYLTQQHTVEIFVS